MPLSVDEAQCSWAVAYIARTNAIHIDALGGPFVAHCLCHLQDASFGTRVRCDVDVSYEGDDGSNVDDLAGTLELEQFLADFLRRHKGSFEVD